MNEEEFKELLKKHDWYFERSDDHKYFCRGESQLREIEAQIKKNPNLRPIYQEARAKAFRKA